MRDEQYTQQIPIVVDMTKVNGKSPRVPSQALDTIVMIEAYDHEQARNYVQTHLDVRQLQPGTLNAVKLAPARKWWTFAVLL